MDMERNTDDLSPIKRYKSDPTLFMDQNGSSNKSELQMSDNSDNVPPSKSVRRQLVARRLSASNLSPRTIMRIPSRLDQIKFEESIDKCIVEAAHEKEVQNAINISRSWEQLSLSDCESMTIDGPRIQQPNYDHVNLLRHTSSSPARSCISPLAVFSSSSSPCNQASRASPVMRHNPMNVAKRKLSINDSLSNPAKRLLLSPGVLNITSGNDKLTSYNEETMSSFEDTPTSSTRIISRSSPSSSPFRCHSDDSTSLPLDSSQPLSFGANLSLQSEDDLPQTKFFRPLNGN